MARAGPKPALKLVPPPVLRDPSTPVTAASVIAFIETLPVTSGVLAGTPFRVRPWQRDILHRIYKPGVRDVVLTMPRKQGKTMLASTLVLAHLVGPGAVPRGQIVSAAADREQAALIFQECKAMVEASPALSAQIHVHETKKQLVAANGSTYTALSADAFRLHGLSPTLVLIDELAQVPGRRLFDALITASGAHQNPLRVVISTVSDDPHHIMSELCHYGEQLTAGILDDPSFVYINYSAPLDADPWDERVWHACNPALGDFRSLDDMRTLARKAQRIPSLKTAFMRYFLNMPVSTDLEGFLSQADWDGCRGAPVPTGPCYGGLDLSSTTDMTALVLFFPDTGAVIPYFWLPGEDLKDRAEKDRAPYLQWVEEGHLRTTPGKVIDKRDVVRTLADVLQDHDVQRIGFDRWRIKELEALLADLGLSVPLEEVGQGFKDMSPAIETLEALVLSGVLAHGKHPVLRWHCANSVITKDAAGNRKWDKRHARSRIDGMVALAMACSLAARERPREAVEPTVMWL